MDGRFVFAMSGWSMSLDIIRFLSYFLVDSGSVHNVQFYFLFLWWKVTRSNGHLMVNLWLNLDFCYVSGIKRGSLDFLGGFFRPSSLDLISGPLSDASAFLVALLPWNLCHIIVYRHLEGTTQTGLQETLKEGRLNDRSKGCRNYCIWTWPLETFAEWVFEHLLHPLLDDWKIAVGMVFLWFLSMIKCPLNSKVELCQLDSNALR